MTNEIYRPGDVYVTPAEPHSLPHSLPLAPIAPATPADLVLYAMKNGGSIDQLREFMALQREWEADQARKAYVADMAEFKKNPPTILKDKQVGYTNGNGSFTGYKHATLGNVTNAIVEGLARNGFSHSWDVRNHGALIEVDCVITHRLGHSQLVTMQAGRDDSGKKNPIQQVASAMTYLQRYTLLLATGLATHDQIDDDGAGAAADPQPAAPDAAQWVAKAKAAPTTAELHSVWHAGEPKFHAAGDTEGLEKLRAACNARKAEIQAARGPDGNRSSRLRDIVGNAPSQPAAE